MAKRKGGRRIKKQTQKETETNVDESAPKCFVFGKGKISAPLKALVGDLKQVMSPYTARALRAQKRNKLRDFVAVAGPLNVSFFLIVSTTDKSSYLRVVRSPRGPTLTFRLNSYSLASDVAASLRKPHTASAGVWNASPLLVLSGFDANVQQEKLCSTMLQNLFPTINAATMSIAACRRVLLLHKKPEAEGDGIELRQYMIKATPTGVSRGVKKLVRAQNVPSLGRYADVADFLLRGKSGAYSSGSEGETDDEEKTELPQATHAAKQGQQVSIKLHELGPRMQMRLIKVQEGLCDGVTLYHALVQKSEAEVAQTDEKRRARDEAKTARREEQESNVQRKRSTVEEKWERKKARREAREAGGGGAEGGGEEGGEDDDDDDGEEGGEGEKEEVDYDDDEGEEDADFDEELGGEEGEEGEEVELDDELEGEDEYGDEEDEGEEEDDDEEGGEEEEEEEVVEAPPPPKRAAKGSGGAGAKRQKR